MLSGSVSEFVDLEVFFLNSTRFLDNDARMTQTILHWIIRYSLLLSPSKLRRLIRSGYRFDRRGLKALLQFMQDEKLLKNNWGILGPWIAKTSGRYCYIPKDFKEDERKYLKTRRFVLSKCPEIRFRAEGSGQVFADIRAYVIKTKFKTLYELAKKIHSPRNRVNESYRLLRKYGVLQ